MGINSVSEGLSQMAAVIVAAGHGQLRKGVSKLLEPLDGKFVLQWVIEEAKKAGFGHIIVTVNDAFGKQITEALAAVGHTDVVFAHQKLRRGPANAVFRALPELKRRNIQSFAVIFGDMPLIAAQSMRHLAYSHWSNKAALGFSSWRCDRSHPLASRMTNYAFVVHPLVFMYTGDLPLQDSEVLSSLYTLDTEWFARTYRRLKSRNKGDGFQPEYHLPLLIEYGIVYPNGATVIRMNEEPQRILGINTFDDLEFVGALLKQQQPKGKP